jgi:DNA-binding response OmpR family regulator
VAKILVVEDDASIALVIEAALTSEHLIVDVCRTATQAKAALKLTEYELLILDWNLPDAETGLEICQKYRDGGGNKPVMLLTARISVDNKVQAFDAGADDYVVKPFDSNELIARVKALLRRPSGLKAEVLTIGNLELNAATFRVYQDGKLIDLLPKEFAILELLMRHADHYFTSEAILSRIWRTDSETSIDSVRTFIKTLRKKLSESEKDQKWQIENKRGLGYRIAILDDKIPTA